MIRWSIAEDLADAGYQVLEAGNADEALKVIQANSNVGLIFTDIDMPGSMDGLKLAALVRDRWPPIRLIVTSGKRIVEITDLPDGSVFFSKPYSHREVAAAVEEMMSA